MKLSDRQQEIIDFIRIEVKKKGYPPSVREIGEAVGLASSSTVHGHLARLEQKGLLRRDPTKPRAIELLGDAMDDEQTIALPSHASMVPIIGKVTAGEPITAIENIEDYFPVPESIADKDMLFALNIQGDSMMDAGIFDGDLVIVRQQSIARNGEIVVAMTDEGEATVKRFFKETDRIRLQPENSTMSPLFFTNVTILGKVVGVFRFIL